MLRALIVAALACALCAGGAYARPVGGAPAVFVSVEGSSQLVGVDLTTRAPGCDLHTSYGYGSPGGYGGGSSPPPPPPPPPEPASPDPVSVSGSARI